MRTVRWHAALVCAIAISLVSVDAAQAQMPLHIVAGPNLGTISSDEFEGAESSVGFFAAVGTSFMVGETVAISPYVGYVQKGAEFDGESASYDYIEIPILINTWFPVGESMNLVVFGGPQFGFQINCDEAGFDCTEFSDHTGTEFGVMAGAGLQFTENFAASIGYDVGLSNLFDEVDYKTRTAFLSLQYTTWLGGSNGNGM